MSKYHSRKTVIDGIEFASKKEAQRYVVLNAMEKAGEIDGLQIQPKYRLIPSQKFTNMDSERPVDYVADFQYHVIKTGEIIVEDVKGLRTKDYVIKRKLFKFTHPWAVFREVK